MGLFNFVLVALFALVVVDSKTIVSSLFKHHQIHPKLHHNRWLQRSNQRRVERGEPSVPVGGDIWPVAIYWAFLDVGNPGAKFPAAIDSGSFTLDIPLQGCKGCTMKPPNNHYDPTNSTTSHLYTCSFFKSCVPQGGQCHQVKKYCGFSNTYETCVPTDPTAPCTITGAWYRDGVSWGGSPSVPVQFGAIQTQTTNFEQFQNIDGVVGMAGPPGNQSVIAQLALNNAIDAWIWSICLKPGSVSNGTITIGGVDSRFYTGSMQYTPNTGGGEFYQMDLQGIKLGDSVVTVVESQVIIDSGTNILLLPDTSYRSMKSNMLSMCSSVQLHGICDVASDQTLFDNVCYDFTQQQIDQFPNITIGVPNIDLKMNPRNYILKDYGVNFKKPGQYCLGISNTGANGLQIVGDTLMENYYVVFDQKNTRIGWAPVSDQCGQVRA